MSTVETAAVDERNDNEGTISNVACVSTEGDPRKLDQNLLELKMF